MISEAIRKKTRSMHMSPEQQQQCIMEYTDSYLLKICGCHEFLLTNDPISRYKVCYKTIAEKFTSGENKNNKVHVINILFVVYKRMYCQK